MPGAIEDSSSRPVDVGPPSNRNERIAKIGTIASAVLASSCCWLPPLLIVAGVSSAGIVSALETYRPLFMVVTFGFLGLAFYCVYRPARAAGPSDCCAEADCCGPAVASGRRFNMMTLNKAMLWVVTVAAVGFLFAPQYVTAWLAPGSDAFTADMTRTVFNVEGMTCKG